jgi:hypothetical protein
LVVVLFLTVLAVTAIYTRFELGITGFGPPRVSFQEHQHDLGPIRSPDQVEYSFAFTNTGQRPAQIDEVQAIASPLSNCSCGMDMMTGSVATHGTGGPGATPITSAQVSSPRIKPGETGYVTVRFNHPTTGTYDGLVQVHSNDPTEPAQTLSLTFAVIP